MKWIRVKTTPKTSRKRSDLYILGAVYTCTHLVLVRDPIVKWQVRMDHTFVTPTPQRLSNFTSPWKKFVRIQHWRSALRDWLVLWGFEKWGLLSSKGCDRKRREMWPEKRFPIHWQEVIARTKGDDIYSQTFAPGGFYFSAQSNSEKGSTLSKSKFTKPLLVDLTKCDREFKQCLCELFWTLAVWTSFEADFIHSDDIVFRWTKFTADHKTFLGKQ